MTHLKWMWLSLVILADIVGVLVGLSFAVPGFFLDPAAALFCFFAVLTLGVTMFTLDKDRR